MTTGFWRDRAACLSSPPDLFNDDHPAHTKLALEICAECPVAAACLADALKDEVLSRCYTIRGGLTSRQRHRLIQQQARRTWMCRNGHDKRVGGLDSQGCCWQCHHNRNIKARKAAA